MNVTPTQAPTPDAAPERSPWAQPTPPPFPPAPPVSPTAGVRTPPRRVATAVIAAAGVLIAGVAVGGLVGALTRGKTPAATSPPATGAGAPSAAVAAARQVYQQAIAAAGASKGFHYVATSKGSAGDQTITGDAGQATGTQNITVASSFGQEQFTLLLVNNAVYFQGNSPALQDQLGVPAAKAATLQGTWISVASGDGPYAVVAPGITVGDQAQEMAFVPTSSSSVSAGGGKATRVTGTVSAAQGASGTAQLDVADGTHLPISEVTSISGSGVKDTTTTTFSAWGSAPSPAAPAKSVAWSTLGASEPPGGYGGGGSGSAPSATPGA